jgi:hypothetical protein
MQHNVGSETSGLTHELPSPHVERSGRLTGGHLVVSCAMPTARGSRGETTDPRRGRRTGDP